LGCLEGVGEAGRGALKSGDTEHGEYARHWGILSGCLAPLRRGFSFEGRPVLLLDQADVAAVSRQVHLALVYDANLDLAAMREKQS
jgi:hypothetical protein